MRILFESFLAGFAIIRQGEADKVSFDLEME
jgi:hypothetical protein